MTWKIVGESTSECGQWHNIRVRFGNRTFWIGWSIADLRWANSKDRTDLEKRCPWIFDELREVVPG